MTLPLCVDIETVAQAQALTAPYPKDDRSPPSNWKDAEKIARWYEEDEVRWQSDRAGACALNPCLGRIVAIGYALPCSDAPSFAVQLAVTEAEEAGLLRDFWTQVGASRGRIATFNGLGFDLRWLVVRSMVHGIEPSLPSDVVRAWFRRYVVAPHFDVRAVLTNWDNRGEGTLGDWCRGLGIPHDDTVSGADIAGLYQRGQFTTIAKHCESDIRSTYALLQKVARVFASEAT